MRSKRWIYTPAQRMLAGGDAAALVLWVIVGLASHQMQTSWLWNVLRVSAPFLAGWFAVAPWTGAYQLPERGERMGFMRRSLVTWLLGVALGLLLRAIVFRDDVPPTFALITLLVTAVFVLGWRATFAWLLYDRGRGPGVSEAK